jgi:tripartite-type tricarboxylate transporter receptor subunit TctC
MRVLLRLAALAAPLLLTLPASAADYPDHTVKLIVPFGAGGPADVYARFLAKYLTDETKQSFVVEDRPGAGSIIGTDQVAKSKPDGYTLLIMSNTHTVNETLLPNKPFELMRDFVPVASINESDLLIVVHPSVPAKSVKEFIDLAKKEPGKLNYASSGPGTPYHMAGELFKAEAGINVVHVPHRASGDARNSVVSGTVQMMFDAVPTMLALAKAGQVRALGTSGSKRNPLTPDLPTVGETVPGYESTIWLGLMAPKGTPKEVIDFLNKHVNAVIQKPEVKEAWLKQGAIPVVKTPAEFDAFLRKDIDKWGKLIKSAHITVQ